VWIPYMAPEQRVLAAFSAAIGGLAAEAEPEAVEEVSQMAGSPAEWFAGRGSRVRQVGGADEDELPGGEDEPRGEGGEGDHGWDEIRDDKPPIEIRVGKPRRLRRRPRRLPLRKESASPIEAVAHDGQTEAAVRLLTRVHPVDEATVRETLEEMRQRMARDGLVLVLDTILDRQSGSVNAKALAEAIRRICKRRSQLALGQLYGRLNHDLNRGSMFLVAEAIQKGGTRRLDPWWSGKGGRAIVWTGDATQDALEEVLQSGSPEFRRALEGAVVHQVAHHGSGACLSLDWVKAMAGAHSVISVGRSNTHHHPSPEVVALYDARVVYENSPPFEWSGMWR
jgi:hypothetical protein